MEKGMQPPGAEDRQEEKAPAKGSRRLATLVAALRILSRDIYCEDGIATQCISDAADEIERMQDEMARKQMMIMDYVDVCMNSSKEINHLRQKLSEANSASKNPCEPDQDSLQREARHERAGDHHQAR